jgi:hypothetical protein
VALPHGRASDTSSRQQDKFANLRAVVHDRFGWVLPNLVVSNLTRKQCSLPLYQKPSRKYIVLVWFW